MNKPTIKYFIVLISSFAIAFGYFKFIDTKYYTSTAVVYPTATLNPQFLLEGGLRFGDEKELNELLEVLQSNDVAIRVINEIQKNGMCNYCQNDITESIKELKNHTKIERNINRSANIIVEDISPNTAAFIANSYIKAAYEHLFNLIAKNITSQINPISSLYESKKAEVSFLQDTLEKLEALNEKKITGLMLNRTPRYRYFDTNYELELKKLGELKHLKENLEGVLKKKTTSLYVVSTATPSTEVSMIKPLVYSFLFSVFCLLSFAATINRTQFFNFFNQ